MSRSMSFSFKSKEATTSPGCFTLYAKVFFLDWCTTPKPALGIRRRLTRWGCVCFVVRQLCGASNESGQPICFGFFSPSTLTQFIQNQNIKHSCCCCSSNNRWPCCPPSACWETTQPPETPERKLVNKAQNRTATVINLLFSRRHIWRKHVGFIWKRSRNIVCQVGFYIQCLSCSHQTEEISALLSCFLIVYFIKHNTTHTHTHTRLYAAVQENPVPSLERHICFHSERRSYQRRFLICSRLHMLSPPAPPLHPQRGNKPPYCGWRVYFRMDYITSWVFRFTCEMSGTQNWTCTHVCVWNTPLWWTNWS